jgi:hypothetical protein
MSLCHEKNTVVMRVALVERSRSSKQLQAQRRCKLPAFGEFNLIGLLYPPHSQRPIRWPTPSLIQSTREGSATLRVRPLRLRLRGDCGFAPSVRGLSSGDGPCSETGARTCHSPSHSVTPGASPAP